MLAKVVIAVSLICVTKGHFIGDLRNDEVDLSVQSSCNPLDCDQSCRRIGFPGGACVNGRCKCDILRNEISDLESSVENYSKVSDVDSSLVRSCNPLECDQSCRRIGFPGGACVNGRCKCDILRNEISDVDSLVVKSCNQRECDQSCRRIGFPGGACVNGRCKCDILRNENVESSVENFNKASDVDSSLVRSCNPLECDQSCRRIGFPGGACVNGRCKCDILRNEISDMESSVVRSCYPLECDQSCRRIGFPGGACVNGKCKCDILRNENEGTLEKQQ